MISPGLRSWSVPGRPSQMDEALGGTPYLDSPRQLLSCLVLWRRGRQPGASQCQGL